MVDALNSSNTLSDAAHSGALPFAITLSEARIHSNNTEITPHLSAAHQFSAVLDLKEFRHTKIELEPHSGYIHHALALDANASDQEQNYYHQKQFLEPTLQHFATAPPEVFQAIQAIQAIELTDVYKAKTIEWPNALQIEDDSKKAEFIFSGSGDQIEFAPFTLTTSWFTAGDDTTTANGDERTSATNFLSALNTNFAELIKPVETTLESMTDRQILNALVSDATAAKILDPNIDPDPASFTAATESSTDNCYPNNLDANSVIPNFSIWDFSTQIPSALNFADSLISSITSTFPNFSASDHSNSNSPVPGFSETSVRETGTSGIASLIPELSISDSSTTETFAIDPSPSTASIQNFSTSEPSESSPSLQASSSFEASTHNYSNPDFFIPNLSIFSTSETDSVVALNPECSAAPSPISETFKPENSVPHSHALESFMSEQSASHSPVMDAFMPEPSVACYSFMHENYSAENSTSSPAAANDSYRYASPLDLSVSEKYESSTQNNENNDLAVENNVTDVNSLSSSLQETSTNSFTTSANNADNTNSSDYIEDPNYWNIYDNPVDVEERNLEILHHNQKSSHDTDEVAVEIEIPADEDNEDDEHDQYSNKKRFEDSPKGLSAENDVVTSSDQHVEITEKTEPNYSTNRSSTEERTDRIDEPKSEQTTSIFTGLNSLIYISLPLRAPQTNSPRAEQDKGNEQKNFLDDKQEKYVVKANDTLESISSHKLGSVKYVPLVYRLNKLQIGLRYAQNGTPLYSVKAGTVLILPSQRQRLFYSKEDGRRLTEKVKAEIVDSRQLSDKEKQRRMNIEAYLGPIQPGSRNA